MAFESRGFGSLIVQLHQRLIRTRCDEDDDDVGDYEDDDYDEDDDADHEDDVVDDAEYVDGVDVVVVDDDSLHPTLSTPDDFIRFVDAFSLLQPRRTPLTRMYSQFW